MSLAVGIKHRLTDFLLSTMILSLEVFYLTDITSEVLPEWRKISNLSYLAPEGARSSLRSPPLIPFHQVRLSSSFIAFLWATNEMPRMPNR